MPWPATADEAAQLWTVYRLGTEVGRRAISPAMLNRFRAHADRNRSAARSAEQFLTRHALDDKSTHTRVFVIDDEVVAFYAMSVGEAVVTGRQRRRLSAQASSNRIPTAHVDWIARDKRAPPGSGYKLLKHAVAVITEDLQPVTPILAVSLDPFDAKTSEAWQRVGFTPTSTQVVDGQCRLLLPLTGYGNVGLSG